MVLPPELRAEYSQIDPSVIESTQRVIIAATHQIRENIAALNLVYDTGGNSLTFVQSSVNPNVKYKLSLKSGMTEIKGKQVTLDDAPGSTIEISGYGYIEGKGRIPLSPIMNLPVNPANVTEDILPNLLGIRKDEFELLADDLSTGKIINHEDYYAKRSLPDML